MNKEQNLRKKSAFTLAEVLITLGIIGVVAALTLPSLIENHQKKAWVTDLQKNYSVLNHGFEKILTDDGVQNLDDTKLFKSMGQDNCSSAMANNTKCKPFFDNLKKYFNFTVVTDPNSNSTVLALADGSILSASFKKIAENRHSKPSILHPIMSYYGKMYSRQAWITIDVNGFKKPNTFGRDKFSYQISGKGKLFPVGGRDYSIYIFGDDMHTWNSSYPNNNYLCGTVNKIFKDGGCTARIMEEGWKMNY